MWFITVLVFILILSVLIFVHEFFHFITAKRNGIRVEEFGMGLPPRIFGFYRENGKTHFFWGNKKIETKSTVYSLNWIPFGGFNNIYGMDSRIKEPGSFWIKNIGTRAKVIFAGVMGNFLLACVLFSIVFASGAPQAIEEEVPEGAFDVGIQVVQVLANSPAESAGIRAGDKIVKMESNEENIIIEEVEDVQNFTNQHLDETIVLTIQRGNESLEISIVPRSDFPEGEGPMGIALTKTARIPYPLHMAVLKGCEYSFWLVGATINAFFEMIKGAIIGQPLTGVELAGPIGIGNLVSQMVTLGPMYVVQFTAILSINLFILNLLPFPALDGGYLLFLLIEKIKKTPVKQEVEILLNQFGFALLMLLMIIITFKDLQKLF